MADGLAKSRFEDQGDSRLGPATTAALGDFSDAGVCRERRIEARRAPVRGGKEAAWQPHVVEHFHQVDDGCSHLAARLLGPLADTYDVKLAACHLVPGPSGKNAAEPDLLLPLSRHDAARVAPQVVSHLEFA